MGRLVAARCPALLACLAASAMSARAVATECVESPGRVLRACVSADAGGAYYEVFRGSRTVIARSALGITFAAGPNGAVTRMLDAVIGEYVVVARLERGGRDWYLGAITNGTARSLEVPLAFLQEGERYEAQIYMDGPGADYRTHPELLAIERRIVVRSDRLTLALAPGGGQAIRFRRLAS
jgi:hypothetical protein